MSALGSSGVSDADDSGERDSLSSAAGRASSGNLPTDCSEVVWRVFEYIDEEMGPEDCARVREHLDECGECLTEYQRDVVLKALIRRSCGCESAPPTLRTQILARITTTLTVTYELD